MGRNRAAHSALSLRAVRPEAHLKDFTGLLQVDGYPGFETLASKTDIKLATCWAHTRRKFYEVHKATGSPIAKEALCRIASLYKIETSVRGQSPNVRLSLRRKYARPMIKGYETMAGAAARLHRRQQYLG